MYFGSPFVALPIQIFPHIRRYLAFIGLTVMVATLIGSSYVENVPALLGTQGVLYAIAAMILYYPAM